MSSNPTQDRINQELDDWLAYLGSMSGTLNRLVNEKNVLYANEKAALREACSKLNLVCKSIKQKLPKTIVDH